MRNEALDDDTGLDQRLDAFEEAWKAHRFPNVRDFLPANDSAQRAKAVYELVAIDLERRLRAQREPNGIEVGPANSGEDLLLAYRNEYPELLESDFFGQLVSQDARIRYSIGRAKMLDDYRARLGAAFPAA